MELGCDSRRILCKSLVKDTEVRCAPKKQPAGHLDCLSLAVDGAAFHASPSVRTEEIGRISRAQEPAGPAIAEEEEAPLPVGCQPQRARRPPRLGEAALRLQRDAARGDAVREATRRPLRVDSGAGPQEQAMRRGCRERWAPLRGCRRGRLQYKGARIGA